MEATTVADLAKAATALDLASFQRAHPGPALVILLSKGSRVDPSLRGDIPEEGLLVTDVFFMKKEMTLHDTQTFDGDEGQTYTIVMASPVIFLPGGARELTVGRGDCDVVLPFATVSSVHALLVNGRDGWTVADSHSTNGTYLNGAALEPHTPARVKEGALLAFGPEVRAQFFSPAALFALARSRLASLGERRPS